MNLFFLRKNPTETVAIVFLLVIGFVGLPYAELGALLSADGQTAEIVGLTLCRLFAALCALFMLSGLGFGGGLFSRGNKKNAIVCAVPALLIAVNNLPIIALASGTAGVTAPADVTVLFALECLCVAAFEELSFRGMIFPLLLQRLGTERKGRFWSVILSSALFGALHFVNLLSGASFGAVALQAGYSFLIGAMLAVLFFEGGSLILCTLVHAVYNFGGLVVPTLGFGGLWEIWNPATIALTAVLSVAAAAFLTFRLLRSDGGSAREFVRFSVSAEEMREIARRR